MIRVFYTPRLRRELRRIVETIASDNPSAASKFVEELRPAKASPSSGATIRGMKNRKS